MAIVTTTQELAEQAYLVEELAQEVPQVLLSLEDLAEEAGVAVAGQRQAGPGRTTQAQAHEFVRVDETIRADGDTAFACPLLDAATTGLAEIGRMIEAYAWHKLP